MSSLESTLALRMQLRLARTSIFCIHHQSKMVYPFRFIASITDRGRANIRHDFNLAHDCASCHKLL